MIRVSIVEDDQLTRESLAELLSLAKGIQVLATYPDAESAITAVPGSLPDVLLVDINLPGKSGITNGSTPPPVRRRWEAIASITLRAKLNQSCLHL